MEGVYQYLIKEVQRVYKMQGVDINDKHIEVIVSQMLGKVKIEEPGDTSLLPGALYTQREFDEANEKAREEGLEPATGKVVLLGYHKSIPGDRFLPFSGIFPGNDESSHRCSHQGQGGSSQRPEGKCHHR